MKNSKNIYDLLNEVEFDIDDYEQEELTDMEKKKLKNHFRQSRRKKFNSKRWLSVAAAFVLMVGIFTQTGVGRRAYAMAESKLTEISYSLTKSLYIRRNIESYANVINQTVRDKGIEIKLTDVIIDKDELMYSIIVNMPEPIDSFLFNYDVYINGKKLRDYGASGNSQKLDESGKITGHSYSLDARGIDTTGDIDIKILLKEVEWLPSETNKRKLISGKWAFEFTANGSELSKDSYSIPLDYAFEVDGIKYQLEEFRYNPVNQKIYGTFKCNKSTYYVIELRGHDNLGNPVNFDLSRSSGKDGYVIFAYDNLHSELSDDATSITLTPYGNELPKESGKVPDNYHKVGEPYTFPIKK